MKSVTLLQINDTHGYLEPHPELFWEGSSPVLKSSGGYAKIASLFESIRAEANGSVIALDCGDTFHGTFIAVSSKGEALIEPVNLLQLDAMTAHWDFAYGPTQFDKILANLNHPMLAINCYREDSGELAYSPYRVIERAGSRVGVIGIAATIVDKTMPAHFSEGLRFTLGDKELPDHVERLRRVEQVDLIVVLSHLGFPQDAKLASQVSGIDAWLSGHTHNRLYEPFFVNECPIIQSGCHGSFVGKLELAIDGGKVVDVKHELIHVNQSIEDHAEMREAVNRALEDHRADLSREIGRTELTLHRNQMFHSPMDDLLLQAVASVTETKIAFSNGWRYGAPIAPGVVTENDLWNIIPSNPPVSTVELLGEEIKQLLETNLENTFARDPYDQMGGFVKRVAGIVAYVKIENPSGGRVQELFVNGEPIDLAKSYRASFVTTQGVPEKFGRNRKELNFRAIEALREYLSCGNEVRLEGCFIAV